MPIRDLDYSYAIITIYRECRFLIQNLFPQSIFLYLEMKWDFQTVHDLAPTTLRRRIAAATRSLRKTTRKTSLNLSASAGARLIVRGAFLPGRQVHPLSAWTARTCMQTKVHVYPARTLTILYPRKVGRAVGCKGPWVKFPGSI